MRLNRGDYLQIDASGLGTSASGASFATSTGDILEIGSFGPGIFRLRIGPDTRPDYGLIAARAQRCEVAQPSRGTWSFGAGDGALELTGNPLSLRLLHGGKAVLTSITDRTRDGQARLPAIGRARDGQSWLAAYALASGEPVYGLGAQTGPLSKRGQLVVSQVEPGDASPSASGTGAPFCWSPGAGGGAWAVYIHTPSRVTHGVGYPGWSQRSYAAVVDDEALDLFLIAGRDPAQLIERYTALTGRAPEVPPWSFGVWIAQGGDGSGDDAASAADLRARRIPCDVLSLEATLSWDRWTAFDFRWDPRRYPDPARTLAGIKQHALKVCVSEQPSISIHSPLFHDLAAKRYLLTDHDGRPYQHAPHANPGSDAVAGAQASPPSGIVDLTDPAAYVWWREAHRALFAAGVDAIEASGGDDLPDDAVASNGDTGARLRNVYSLLHSRCVFDASAKFARAEPGPPLLWGSAGWSGSQRYPVQSPGETQGDWEGLAASIRASLSTGMSGVPYRASEVGGAAIAPELYLRWLQAGVFASHLRLRAGGAHLWTLDPDQEKIALQWLGFRYRLLPYLRGAAAQAASTGMPVMRGMPLAFPANALTRAHDTQFMCGDALLVAPIIAPGGEVDVALPPGAWYDLATRQRLAGRQVIRYRATLDRFPVFGREGHALPLGPAVQHSGEIDTERPLNALWLFGKTSQALDGFAQVKVALAADGASITATTGVQIEVFGDPAGVRINPPV